MPSKSILTASLTPELTSFIGEKVASGRYRTASEVVRAGLRALEKEDAQSVLPAPMRSHDLRFLDGAGEMGGQVRDHDWSQTPLGPIERWPQSLKTAVSMVLNSRFPTYMAWGPELTSFYNDAYRPVLGTKPESLGRPFREVWAEAWSTVGPIAERAMAGEASFFENLPLTLLRNGHAEETWWSFSYSPVRDETGGVGGVLCTVYESTAEVEARSALEWEKKRLEALFQQAPGIMATLSGPDHVFELANASYLELVGIRDLIGKPVRQAIPEVVGQGFYELLDEVYATGQPHIGRQVPIELKRRNGGSPERRYVDFVYQPITDEHGAVTGIFVEGHDVTDAKLSEIALSESNERFRLFSDETREGVVIHDGQIVLDCNSACAQMFGYSSTEEILGLAICDFVAAGDIETVREKHRGGNAEPYEVEARRKDGSTFRAEFVGRDAEWHGQKVRVALARDLTDEHRRAEALRASEGQLRLALDAGRMAVWRSGSRDSITTSPELNHLFGFPPDATPGVQEIRSRYAPGEQEKLLRAVKRCLERGENHAEEELEVIWPDGSHHWLLLRAEIEVFAGERGRDARAIGVALDITARKRWEEHQRLLVNELNHRVKNTLTTVQSIARQTLRATATDLGPLDAFEARLLALSRAHDVLTRENWEGAELREVIDEVLEPYRREAGESFDISGPRLRLSPKTALALAMAVHELATNAAKYGALSVAAGRVAIFWEATGSNPVLLMLQWRERGGPPVMPPTRKGFGTRLIGQMLAHDLNGEVNLTYEPSGVVCTIKAPLPDEGSGAGVKGRAVA